MTADEIITQEADLVKVFNTWLQGCVIHFVLVCIDVKLHPQVGFVLWRWCEGCGAWLKDLFLTNHLCWGHSSRLASKDAGWLMSYRRLPLLLLCLRLYSCGNCVWSSCLIKSQILGVIMVTTPYGYYGFIVKHWLLIFSSSLSPLLPSLYACLQHCGVIPGGAYQPPLGNRFQVLNLQQGGLRPFRVLPAPTPVQEDVHRHRQ